MPSFLLLVNAECQVKDEQGTPIPIGPYYSRTGVEYDAQKDKLSCLGPSVCSKWTITDCHVVKCEGEQACLGTKFYRNKGISCSGDQACHNAHMFESQTVACGLNDQSTKKPCSLAMIQISHSLLCFGVNACVSDYDERMTVQTGATGVIRCDNSSNGEATKSCRNMVVDVKHSRRACFANTWNEQTDPLKHCAVVCESNAGECDKQTIRFRT
ncbi:hypothetical protein ACA910_020797 [Epithemia clementina (nom. ined.)]